MLSSSCDRKLQPYSDQARWHRGPSAGSCCKACCDKAELHEMLQVGNAQADCNVCFRVNDAVRAAVREVTPPVVRDSCPLSKAPMSTHHC